MPQKSIAFLIILFAAVLSLSISGKLDISFSRPTQTLKPKIIQTPKPTLLPLDSPISIIKEFIFPSPKPTPPSLPVSENKSFQSIEELQQSLNISLDLAGGGIPFGGKVQSIDYCDSICDSPYDMIKVGPPRGGAFLIGPTVIYREYDYSVGNWVLGLANGFDECLVLVFDECIRIGAGPIVDIMGTSK